MAQPIPEAIASAIAYILDNPQVAEKMSKFGVQYMKNYPLEKGLKILKSSKRHVRNRL